MKKLLSSIFALLVVVTLSALSTPEAKGQGVAPVAKASWEQKWERTLAAAKKEGMVRAYVNWPVGARVAVGRAFREKYGIEAEFTPFSGGDLIAKALAEKRAGIQQVDAFGAGGITLLTGLKPGGILASLEPYLILPEVTNPQVWTGSKFPFTDKDKTIVSLAGGLQRYVAYNNTMIKEDEITSLRDLLKPVYKGKIVFEDPSIPGLGSGLFSRLANDVWNFEEASEFLRRLIKQQGVFLGRDKRLLTEWVARGKYPIGLALSSEQVIGFARVGTPIKVVTALKEGSGLNPGAAFIGLPAVMAHPNAAAVFLNWLLTKEGQMALAVQGFGYTSLRLDVPAEGIHPFLVPVPGEKLWPVTEKTFLAIGRAVKEAKGIIAEARK